MANADDQDVHPGVWNQFRWSVLALAMDAHVQLSLFPDFTCKPYELASDFDHWFEVATRYFPTEFTKERIELLQAIDQKTVRMSLGGAEFDEALWTNDAL